MLLKLRPIVTIIALTAIPCALAAEKPAAAVKYLFSYFKGNGEDGLHLAVSDDGLKWTTLNNDRSFLPPQVGGKLMRDPCICRGPDGQFHLVWTTGWWDKGIGIAHSADLIHWSPQESLPVMAKEPNAMNCWAPEIFYDHPGRQYIIFWSTTIPGRFPETDNTGDPGQGGNCNHRIYCVTTPDFNTYSPTKLFYDGGFNVIDATIIQEGSRFVMLLKDETRRPQAKKNIRVAVAEKATGPYGPASPPFSPAWVEGPTALRIGGFWHVFYDAYTRNRYEGVRSKDLAGWETINDKLSFPNGARHGTVFAVPTEIVDNLMQSTQSADKPAQPAR